MENLKLSNYKLKKGVLISPFNEFMSPLSTDLSWFTGRLPEYVWIGLIFDWYERKEAMDKCISIIDKLIEIEPSLQVPAWSEILKMSMDKQKRFFSYLVSLIDKQILYPLTCITTFSDSPIFIEYFYADNEIKKRINKLISFIRNVTDHQTHKSTDIRYIVLLYSLKNGKTIVPPETIEMLNQYRFLSHDAIEMRIVRPNIRSGEMLILNDFTKIELLK